MKQCSLLLCCLVSALSANALKIDIKNRQLHNDAPYIVSQCYTKTKDAKGGVHNPCLNCHRDSKAPNYIDDWDLQESYAFPEYALTNHWTNLFIDRSKAVSQISDAAIRHYVNESNYFDANGSIVLAKKLKNLPEEWDIDGDGRWDGYIPDCYYHFDREGFDHAPDGNYTGWRAFGYTPFLGTFWPTNGSTDDVLIRLSKDFSVNDQGEFDIETYRVNLWIVEALIKQKSIQIDPIDERKYGVDLDKDGRLGMAEKIAFDYDPLHGRMMSYVGYARKQQYQLAAGLYPVGTEFLHSVRYLSAPKAGRVGMAARMKELRYGRKVSWADYGVHAELADEEIKERNDYPDRLMTYIGDAERGVSNKRGWRYQGFIEDADGALRPQSYEEHLNCIGCHATLGSLVDSTFVFPRKLERGAFQNGWYHWSQKGLAGMPEPKMPDGSYEYTRYLQENGAGDEFRDNAEVMQRFFDQNGTLLQSETEKLHRDIAYLLIPSVERALQLDKAYRVIVDEQSFIYGRDAHIAPIKKVHRELKEDEKTGVTKPVKYLPQAMQ